MAHLIRCVESISLSAYGLWLIAYGSDVSTICHQLSAICDFARLASETFLTGLTKNLLYCRKLESISCCTVKLFAFGLSLAMSSSANCIPLIVGFPSSGKARAL